jgi:hypothetical protein
VPPDSISKSSSPGPGPDALALPLVTPLAVPSVTGVCTWAAGVEAEDIFEVALRLATFPLSFADVGDGTAAAAGVDKKSSQTPGVLETFPTGASSSCTDAGVGLTSPISTLPPLAPDEDCPCTGQSNWSVPRPRAAEGVLKMSASNSPVFCWVGSAPGPAPGPGEGTYIPLAFGFLFPFSFPYTPPPDLELGYETLESLLDLDLLPEEDVGKTEPGGAGGGNEYSA